MFMNGKELKWRSNSWNILRRRGRMEPGTARQKICSGGGRNMLEIGTICAEAGEKDRQGVCEHGNGSGYGSAASPQRPPARIAALAKEVFLRSSWSAEAAEDLRTAKFRHISRM